MGKKWKIIGVVVVIVLAIAGANLYIIKSSQSKQMEAARALAIIPPEALSKAERYAMKYFPRCHENEGIKKRWAYSPEGLSISWTFRPSEAGWFPPKTQIAMKLYWDGEYIITVGNQHGSRDHEGSWKEWVK